MTVADRTDQLLNQGVRNLVEDIPRPEPYVFVEHVLPPAGTIAERRDSGACRTFLVTAGLVRLEFLDASGNTRTKYYTPLDGWHAPEGSVYRVVNDTSEQALLVEAGLRAGGTAQPVPCLDVSRYTVQKPWGHEVWYTQNLPDAPYAVKQISMVAGHQSSLQSHERKIETNFVVAGGATVLNGTLAPDDRTATVDASLLPRTVHGPRTGWSSARNVLHRVIAEADYTSIEVSTPELDDVIRWADDTSRSHGRIDAEHRGASQRSAS
jgi:mannose-6-phosphate isomerase-like protein (cupin superfamily)